MHKRILCALLAALILLSLIPILALPSRAASNMKTSERCIAILKQMEGFVKYPMKDNTQYSVGYGSGCDPDDYPNGITEAEADALLREYLVDMEKSLNDLANREGIIFSQNQFDALMLFTYNCGVSWTYGDGEFRKSVVDGNMGNTFICNITQWSFSGNQMLEALIDRRLIEADMYINGSYENVRPANFLYVLYDNNQGSGPVKIQGYDCDMPACVKALPSREGYRFLGWYTAAEGGAWITELTAAHGELTLYAHWQAQTATAEDAPEANYQLPSDRLASRDYYETPGGKVVGMLNESAVAEITAEFVDESGNKWGKLRNDCWVLLGDSRIGIFDETEAIEGVRVTITGDYVNVRSGPGTGYKATAAVLEGDEVLITQTRMVGNTLWGKFRGGWICMDYTDYSGGLKPSAPDENDPLPEDGSEMVIATGTVRVNELNIRATAGTHGYLMGSYAYGDKVEILEKAVVGGAPWGRTNRGWICLTYVILNQDQQRPEETTKPSEPVETTKPSEPEESTTATTPPETTAPGEEKAPTPPDPQKGIPGTVISKTGLNIRSGPGAEYMVIGNYNTGAKIDILDQRTVDGVVWGCTDRGWVSLQYVQLQESWSNENGIHGTVICSTPLNIRSAAGTFNPRVGYYNPGQHLIVYEQCVISGQKWGRTELGWVCMSYVTLDQVVTVPSQEDASPETTQPETKPQPEEPKEAVTGIVTAGGLNIRSKAGITGAIVGGYYRGDRVTILEQTLINGTVWGRTDKGWICLSYVSLDMASGGSAAASFTGTITAGLLCIRKGPGTGNSMVGTYQYGETVTILETTKLGATTWGRTELGWICMNYVK